MYIHPYIVLIFCHENGFIFCLAETRDGDIVYHFYTILIPGKNERREFKFTTL